VSETVNGHEYRITAGQTDTGDIVPSGDVPTLPRAFGEPGIPRSPLYAGATLHYLPQYSPDLNPIENDTDFIGYHTCHSSPI
jgi:hypothetical protein